MTTAPEWGRHCRIAYARSSSFDDSAKDQAEIIVVRIDSSSGDAPHEDRPAAGRGGSGRELRSRIASAIRS